MTTALFRCDASPAIGMGHWVRCLNLADALAQLDVTCIFSTVGTSDPVRAMVRNRGHQVIWEDGPQASHGVTLPESDALSFGALRQEHGAAIAILDHYGIDAAWLRGAALDDCCTVLLEDVDRDRGLAQIDVISCPTPGSQTWFEGFGGTRCCGPEWALLHPAFAAARPVTPVVSDEIQSVMVAMGGSDAAGLVPHVLSALAGLTSPPGVTVVGFQDQEHAPPSGLTVRWQHGLSPAEMAALMLASDLVITTPSTTMWELATIGCAAVVIPAADNQHPNGRALQELDAACVVWDQRNLPAALIEVLPRERRQSLIQRARDITDGMGAPRLARLLKETTEP